MPVTPLSKLIGSAAPQVPANQNGPSSFMQGQQPKTNALIPKQTVSKPTPLSSLASNKPSGISSFFNKVGQVGTDVGKGLAKSGLGLVKGTGEIAGSAVNAMMGKGFTPNAPGGLQETPTAKKVFSDQNTTPQGTGETVGKYLGDAAQLLAPTGVVGDIEKGVSGSIDMSKALPSIVKAGAKIASKTLLEGLFGGAVTAAQTGSVKKGAESGAIFGGLAGVTSSIGEGLKALKIPERLYSGIFRDAYKDMTDVLKTGGQAALKDADPELFKKAVDAGIIKVGKDGSVTLDQSLAQQALERGLKGSVTNMSNQIVKGIVKSELEVRQAVKGFKGIFTLPTKQLTTILLGVADRFEGVGMNEISDAAKDFIKQLKDTGGELGAETTLNLRRFMDRMRIESSFDQNIPKAQQQQNFKYWTDKIRGMLVDKIPALKDTMKNYSFYMDALTSVSKAAVREGNKKVFGLIDAVLFGGAVSEDRPVLGGIFSIVNRLADSPSLKTKAAQAIENGAGSFMTSAGKLTRKAVSDSVSGANTQDR